MIPLLSSLLLAALLEPRPSTFKAHKPEAILEMGGNASQQHHQFYQTIVPVGTVFRRPHKKSRTGCQMCKHRRIKCGEERPRCRNCVSKGKICQYPDMPRLRKNREEKAVVGQQSSPSPEGALSEVSDSFSLHDLKLFHHFLSFAHPSLPLGNKSAWTQDIPQLVHQSDHLMHAFLALGASHIGSLSGTDRDQYTALLHRGRAIAGLKNAFAKSDQSSLEYDAMLATCYALAFQSALVPAGSIDFATFVRGCALVTERIQHEGKQTIFKIHGDPTRCPTQHTTSDRLGSTSLLPGSHLDQLITKGSSL